MRVPYYEHVQDRQQSEQPCVCLMNMFKTVTMFLCQVPKKAKTEGTPAKAAASLYLGESRLKNSFFG